MKMNTIKKKVLILIFSGMVFSVDGQVVNNHFQAIQYWMENDFLKNGDEDNGKLVRRLHSSWDSRVDSTGSYDTYKDLVADYLTNNPTKAYKEKGGKILFTELGPKELPLSSTQDDVRGMGQVTCVYDLYNEDSTLYAGTLAGGLWRYRPSEGWLPLTDNWPTFGITDIEIDPEDYNKLYIGSGTHAAIGSLAFQKYYGIGVLISKDGGNEWKLPLYKKYPKNNLQIQKIVIDKINKNIVYALTPDNIYKSMDGGDTWDVLNPPFGNSIYEGLYPSSNVFVNIVIIENNNDCIFVAARNGELYRSCDAGKSWSSNLIFNFETEFKYSDIIELNIETTSVEKGRIYAMFKAGEESINDWPIFYLQYSDDLGATWSYVGNPNKNIYQVSGSVNCNLKLSISPTDTNDIVATMVQMFEYIYNEPVMQFDNNMFGVTNPDNGYTLFGSDLIFHGDIRDILRKEYPSSIVTWYAHDGGLSYTVTPKFDIINTNDSPDFMQGRADKGIGCNLFWNIDVYEGKEEIILGGSQDMNTLYYENDVWHHTGAGDGGQVLIDKFNPNIRYTRGKFIYRSSDGFKDFFSGNCVEENNGNCLRVNIRDEPFVQDDLGYIYFSSWDVIKYIQGNNIYQYYSFNPDSSDPIKDAICTNISFSEYDYDNIKHLFITQFKNENGDVGYWNFHRMITNNEVVDLSEFLPNEIKIGSMILCAKVHPYNNKQIWITVGGFVSGCKVYESSDGGFTWKNISYNLTDENHLNFPAQCIEVNPYSGDLFLGMDIGLYYLEKGTSEWVRLTDVPVTFVTDMELKLRNGKLYVATYGRGVWRGDIPGEGFCKDDTPLIINQNTIWDTKTSICSDVIVKNGATLSVTATGDVTMGYLSKFTVETGGTLIINKGKITNLDLLIQNGGNMQVNGDGKILLNIDDNIDMEKGARADYNFMDIQLIQN